MEASKKNHSKTLQKGKTGFDCLNTLARKHYAKKLKDTLKDYFKGKLQTILFSLKKLLVQSEKDEYSLNPYLAEVFFSFYQDSKEIKTLPTFQTKPMPEYDKIYQAQLRGDFSTFYNWIRKNRKAGKYQEVIAVLEKVFGESNTPERILNEIGITYKWSGNYKKAKEILEKSLKINPKNVKTLNELAIIHKARRKFSKSS